MADTVTITAGENATPPDGTVIATDDTGAGGHAQIVKLAISTDGSATLIPAEASNGLDVDVTRVSGNVTVVQGTAANLNAVVTGSGSAGTAATGVVTVQGITSMTPVQVGDNASSLTVDQATASSLNAQVVGSVAHDGNTANNPVVIGARAETAISGVTKVADGDVTHLYAGIDGVLIVRPHANIEDFVSGNASNTDGASTQLIAASGSANIRVLLGAVSVSNTSATTVYVEIKDGTTVKWTLIAPAGGGNNIKFDPPLVGTANTAWNFDPSAAATTIYCSGSGFKSPIV